jgi:protein-tyrosine phosphatase
LNNPAARRVLFVCTANICRSPTAEYLARNRFGEDYWRFRSAGFLPSGRIPSDTLVQALAELDIDAREHRSYQLDRASIAAADLLLTMEGSHVRQATEIESSAYPKTVPLREAAMMLEDWDGSIATIEELRWEIARERDPGSYLGEDWDVDDPYGRSLRVYRRTVAEIGDLVDIVLGRLR